MVDCEVIQADGGTRTAAITGGFIALAHAVRKLQPSPIVRNVAAVSAGYVKGDLLLDLAYAEDSIADADVNVVATSEGELIQVQGTAEGRPFSRGDFDRVLAWTSLAADSKILRAMEWLVALEVLALGGFVVVQTRGLAARGGRLLARVGVSRFEGHATLGRIDEGLAAFYRKRPGRLTLSIACHLVAWLLGAVEAWLILRFLGMPVSWITATVIEAFGTGIRFATFLVLSGLASAEALHGE